MEFCGQMHAQNVVFAHDSEQRLPRGPCRRGSLDRDPGPPDPPPPVLEIPAEDGIAPTPLSGKPEGV